MIKLLESYNFISLRCDTRYVFCAEVSCPSDIAYNFTADVGLYNVITETELFFRNFEHKLQVS